MLKYLLIIALSIYGFVTTPSQAQVNVQQADTILKDGYNEVVKAIALRDKLDKAGIDYNKAANIPELEAQFPILTAYYHEAMKGQPEKATNLEKILKQMKGEFAKKAMPRWKWGLFHRQLNALFTEDNKYLPKPLLKWGNLNFKQAKKAGLYKDTIKGFPWFVYIHNGILGLQTINYAFINDIMILPMATDKELEADGSTFTAYQFTAHDVAHFNNFRESAYTFKRFKVQIAEIYKKIEQQPNLADRLGDQFILFMLIHEFPYGNQYPENFKSVLQNSSENLINSFSEREPKALNPKSAIYTTVNIFDHKKELKIKELSKTQYEVTGTPIKSKKPHTLIVTLATNNKGYVITYKDLKGKTITEKRSIGGRLHDDFIPVLEALGNKPSGPWTNGELATRVKALSANFMKKYGS